MTRQGVMAMKTNLEVLPAAAARPDRSTLDRSTWVRASFSLVWYPAGVVAQSLPASKFATATHAALCNSTSLSLENMVRGH